MIPAGGSPVAFVKTSPDGVPPEVMKPPLAFVFKASAVTTPVPSASQTMTVVAELTIAHGAVAPAIVVVPGVIELAPAGVTQLAAVVLDAVKT